MNGTARQTHRTTLLLARHGETVWHADNRYAGADNDIDLTERGHRQAEQLGAWVAAHHVDHIVSSPVRRAIETATPAARRLGIQVGIVDALREVGFGIAEGRAAKELAREAPQMLRKFRENPVDSPFPGAEPPQDAARRGATALREIAAQHSGCRILVVAHNTLLRLALCELLGIAPSQYRRFFPRLDNAAICELTVPSDTVALASLRALNVPVSVQ